MLYLSLVLYTMLLVFFASPLFLSLFFSLFKLLLSALFFESTLYLSLSPTHSPTALFCSCQTFLPTHDLPSLTRKTTRQFFASVPLTHPMVEGNSFRFLPFFTNAEASWSIKELMKPTSPPFVIILSFNLFF